MDKELKINILMGGVVAAIIVVINYFMGTFNTDPDTPAWLTSLVFFVVFWVAYVGGMVLMKKLSKK